MKKTHLLSSILIGIILAAAFTFFISSSHPELIGEQAYVGVSFGGNSTQQAKLLIDKVKSYTNIFVLHSGINEISKNESAVKEICDYAINSGLSIIVNLGTYTPENWQWQLQFYNSSKVIYGEKFLGAYYDDEPGGIPFDWDWNTFFTQNSSLFYGPSRLSLKDIHYKLQMTELSGKDPDNYTQEAEWFRQLIAGNRGFRSLKENNITTITSDYVLYWFDLYAGYDSILAQIGWNMSLNLQLSLLRGAAQMQNKDWGVILTWKYTHPPYLDTGQNILSQMKDAYNAGSKYILLFDFPYNLTDNPYPYGVLTDDHFEALETFWRDVATKQTPSSPRAQAALVLPKDYGWGIRNPEDKIFGFCGPDAKSPLIWNNTQILLNQYGLGLDIIYEDLMFPIQANYSKIYYWNQTLT